MLGIVRVRDETGRLEKLRGKKNLALSATQCWGQLFFPLVTEDFFTPGKSLNAPSLV